MTVEFDTQTATGWTYDDGKCEPRRAVGFDPLIARQVGQLSEICGRLLGTLDRDHLLLDRD